jgi:SAM-dependent methyltransferase
MALSSTNPAETMLAIRDRYLVPSLLSPFADDMARRLSRLVSGPLLEIYADTGILTQAMVSAMSAGLSIIATDPNPENVAHASIKPGMARVTWQKADPDALPFGDGRFGIIACHFGVAGTTDRVQTFQETHRVMRTGGRFVFSLPGHIRHNPISECLQGAMNNLFPGDPPRFVECGLHGCADNEALDDDLTEAGFTDAIYTTIELPYAAASARDTAIGYCLGTPLRQEIEARAPGEAELVTEAAAAALRKRFGTGPIEASMRAHIVSASG